MKQLTPITFCSKIESHRMYHWTSNFITALCKHNIEGRMQLHLPLSVSRAFFILILDKLGEK